MAISLLVSSALLASMQAQDAPQPSDEQPQVVEAAAAEDAPLEAADAEPAAGDAAVEEDKIICRNTRIVGSRFNKRICGTKAQWEAMSRRGKDATDEFRRKGRSIRQAGG